MYLCDVYICCKCTTIKAISNLIMSILNFENVYSFGHNVESTFFFHFFEKKIFVGNMNRGVCEDLLMNTANPQASNHFLVRVEILC